MSQSASEHAVHFVTPPLRSGRPYENPALPELPNLWSLDHPDTAPIPDEAACRALWTRYAMFSHIERHSECVAGMAEALARRAVETGATRHPELVALSLAAGLLHDIAKSYMPRSARHGWSIPLATTRSPKPSTTMSNGPGRCQKISYIRFFSSFMRTSGPATTKWYRSTSAMKICLSAMEKANTPAPPSIAAGNIPKPLSASFRRNWSFLSMKVLLLAGGWSPEREVSLKGGEQIAAALKERGHSVTLCDPAKDFERLMDMAREHDAAFINLHGAPGEDGLVQAILDRVNCPYQGAGPAGSFLALHKAAARQIFRDAGLNIPDGVFLPRHPGPNWKPDLQYPMFVKSNTGGSSLHLSRVTNEEELYTALNSLFSMGEEAIVETAVVGREVTCGVLGEEALAPILVVSKGNYFDYHNKYAPDGAQEICPAPIAPEETAKVQDAALRAHHALGLKGYSRADFILQDDGTLYILEVNTTPGMTSTSLVPREAAVKGMSFADLVERLLELALER